MDKQKQANNLQRLIFGFSILVLIFLFFGLFNLYSNHLVSSLTHDIYNHPLVVSNAALQANISITKMQSSMKDVVLSTSPLEISRCIKAVNEQEREVYAYLDTVKERIIGDEGKALENDARKLFDNWRPVREEVIECVRQGEKERAAGITIGKGADYVVLLEEKTLGLTAYARKEALGFINETERVQSRQYQMSVIFLLLGILASSMVAFLTIRRIISAETELQKSEHRYRRLFEDSPVSLWEEDFSEFKDYIDMLKTKGVSDLRKYFDENPDELTVCAQKIKILDVNKATLALHQAESKEALLGNLVKTFTEKSFDVFKEEIITLARGGTEFESEAQVKTLSGEKRDIHLRFSATTAGENNTSPVRALIAINDITERKYTEYALRENEQRYKKAERMGHVGNWEYDIMTERFWGSDEAKRIYGFNPENKDFTTEEVESCIPERDRVHQALIDLIEEDKLYNLEFEIRPVSGPDRRIIRSIAEIVKDNSGVPIKVSGVIQDITDRKRAEDEKKLLEEQFRQAQKMESVGRLAGGVAHDYNNALGVIIGYTELAMLDMDLGRSRRAHLDEILAAAKRAASVTRQLLAFARKQTIAPKVIDLNENVESMLKMLRRLIGEDINLAWLPSANLWPVKMDVSQLDQILANLCVNARDAITGVGKVTIETGNVTFSKAYCADHAGFVPGAFVLLAVSDNGCGMDKDILDNIFEPFFTTKNTDKGTGLGLATVYGIVKQNNGFINVYSEPGQGTTIKIYLPRHEGSAVEIQRETAPEIPPPGCGETVLLVEDDLVILELVRMILDGLGYTVLSAGTPAEAMGLAEKHPGKIHLLITDVVMPKMNGRELAERIQSFYPDLKLLFMSGYTANVIAHHGVLNEGVRFIQKPFSQIDLAKIVRKALDE